jgi:predicted RNase H-like HicB family nuclease
MQRYTFTAEIERGSESGFYVGRVPALPGAHTQAQSLDQLQLNLKQVVELCLESLTQQELASLN